MTVVHGMVGGIWGGLLGQDATCMVQYYLDVFGESFLSPEFIKPPPHPVLSLQKYTDSFVYAVGEKYWLALKKLRLVRKDVRRTIENIEMMQAENKSSNESLWRIEICQEACRDDSDRSEHARLSGKITQTILDTEHLLHR